MTVSELIEELRKYDGDMQVAVHIDQDDYTGNVGVLEKKLFHNPENDFYGDMTGKENDRRVSVVVIW